MSDLISIVVPVYNAEKTLDRCVRSLLGQTYENIEILLVNDGSRDGSLEVCRRLAGQDSRIRVVDKENGGVSSARNAGLDAATGRFVMFCDSDDWVEPDWCSVLQAHHTSGNLVICEIGREDMPVESHTQPTEIAERRHYLHYPMLMCSPCNKLFERAVLEENDIRFLRELSLGEDFVFCLRYLTAVSGKLQFVYQPLYNYDTTNETTLSHKAPPLEQCCRFFREVDGAMEKLDARDEKSTATRDWLVAPHFERFLLATAANNRVSMKEKLKIAGNVAKMEEFLATRKGIRWGNPLLLRLYHGGNLKAWMSCRALLAKLK